MSKKNTLLKMLNILINQKIWVSDDVNVHSLYLNDKLKLVKGVVKDYSNTLDLTNEYLKYKREVFTGRPEKSYTDNWSTYKNCTDIQLYFDGTSVKLQIQLFEGDSFNGHREELIWKGEFELNLDSLNAFKEYIEYAFNDEIDSQFEIEEKKRIQKRKAEIRQELLSE